MALSLDPEKYNFKRPSLLELLKSDNFGLLPHQCCFRPYVDPRCDLEALAADYVCNLKLVVQPAVAKKRLEANLNSYVKVK